MSPVPSHGRVELLHFLVHAAGDKSHPPDIRNAALGYVAAPPLVRTGLFTRVTES